jgi:hypothetical protein
MAKAWKSSLDGSGSLAVGVASTAESARMGVEALFAAFPDERYNKEKG